MDYRGLFWSQGWRAEVWLSIVPNMALSSSPVAGKGHLGELVLPGQCQAPLTWIQPGLHRILEMLQHLKWCWALKGAQLDLAPGVNQSYPNAASCQKWGHCVLLIPQHTQTPWNQAQVKQIAIVQEKTCNIHSDQTTIGNRRFQPVFFTASRNLMKTQVQPQTDMEDTFTQIPKYTSLQHQLKFPSCSLWRKNQKSPITTTTKKANIKEILKDVVSWWQQATFQEIIFVHL